MPAIAHGNRPRPTPDFVFLVLGWSGCECILLGRINTPCTLTTKSIIQPPPNSGGGALVRPAGADPN